MKASKLILIAMFFISQLFAQNIDVNGIWSGKLELPNKMKLTIIFNIHMDENGKYQTSIDSPDQGAKGIKTSRTKITSDSIIIESPIIRGTFTGRINLNENRIEGKWIQGGISLDLIVNKVDEIEESRRPQEPEEPFPYKSEEISFKNGVDNVLLSGTLTLPENESNLPAVVLITGSGPQNRDEELLGHKPFLVLSDFLTRNGFAVLRFDDRGVGKSTGTFVTSTSEDFARDVLAAVEFLKTRNEIDKTKIGLIGHSEGGIIAPMVAVRSNDVSFIVLMAGTGVPGDSILIMQNRLIQKAEGVPEKEIDETTDIQRKLFQLVIKSSNDEILQNQLGNKLNEYLSTIPDEQKNKLGDLKTYINMQVKTFTSPWFKYFLEYNPAKTLEKVKCPVLALNGSNDLQVSPEENLSAIENALKKGGNKNYEIEILPGLNHLFQTSKTGAVSEYSSIEETISPMALNAMLEWMKKIAK